MASGKSDLRSCIAWASFPSAAFMSIPNFRPLRMVVSALNVRSMKRFSITFADSTRSRAVLTTTRAWSNSPWRTCSFAWRKSASASRESEPNFFAWATLSAASWRARFNLPARADWAASRPDWMSAKASRKFSVSARVRASENLFWTGVGSISIFRHVSTRDSPFASSSDVRLQQAEAPIDAAREGGPRPFDLAGLEGDLPFLEELLELRRIGADLVSRLEEPLGLVPDVLHLFEQDPEIGDRVRRADRRVERLHVVPVVVHPPGIGNERGDGEGPFADRAQFPLDGLDGLFRHPLLKAHAFGFLFALLGRRDRLAVLLRPEELARPFEQPLRGSGVRPVHPGAEEVLFEAFHPRGDPAVPFLRCLGFGLRGVVEGFLELAHLVRAVGPREQAGRRGQGQAHRLRIRHDFPEPTEGRRGFVSLTLEEVELFPQAQREVGSLLQLAGVEVLAGPHDRVAGLRQVHALDRTEDGLRGRQGRGELLLDERGELVD